MDQENQKLSASKPGVPNKGIQKPADPRSMPPVPTPPESAPGGGQKRGPRRKKREIEKPTFRNASGKQEPNSPEPSSKFSWLTNDTGRTITIINAAQLQASTSPVSSGAGFELLCTYNWVSTQSPTIYVPGGPPQWTPVTLPTTLPKDAGTHFIDQNAFRAPAFPFEPIFAALDDMNPHYDFGAVDLVTNRNSLRKLLNFASERAPESFRIDLNMVYGTLFLNRTERSTRDVIRGSSNTGYGRNFEKAFTRAEEGLEESSGHHRVVRYRMGELDCVVRFEVDAWCESNGKEKVTLEEPASRFEGIGVTPELGVDQGGGDVLEEFKKLSLSQAPILRRTLARAQPRGTEQTKLEARPWKVNQLLYDGSKDKGKQYQPTQVIGRGRIVPCSTLAEIKAKKKKARLAEALPQLWFGRTPLLLHATHDEGLFIEEIALIDAAGRFEDWENQQQEGLRKMVKLIGQLKDVAQEAQGGACVVVCEHKIRPLRLEIFESTTRKRALPEEIVERYWREGRIPPRP